MAFTREQVVQHITGLPQKELTARLRDASLGKIDSAFGWGAHYHPDSFLGDLDGRTAPTLPRFLADVYAQGPIDLDFRGRLRGTLGEILDGVTRPETPEATVSPQTSSARSRMALIAIETVTELGHYSGDQPNGPQPPPELDELGKKVRRVMSIPQIAEAHARAQENGYLPDLFIRE